MRACREGYDEEPPREARARFETVLDGGPA